MAARTVRKMIGRMAYRDPLTFSIMGGVCLGGIKYVMGI